MRRRRRKGLDWLRLNALSNFRLAPILVRIVVSFFIPVTNRKTRTRMSLFRGTLTCAYPSRDLFILQKTTHLTEPRETRQRGGRHYLRLSDALPSTPLCTGTSDKLVFKAVPLG